MSVSGVILQPTIIRGKALDYFRFMTGREVRARVVQGGEPGNMAVLRMGEHVIKARIQGMAIPAGKNLFVRIEKDGGGYRLITLDKTGIPTPGPGIPATAPGDVPPAVLLGFREFLERTRRTIKGMVSRTPDKPGATEAGGTAGAGSKGKIELDMSMMETLGRIMLNDAPAEQEMDGLIFLAWREETSGDANPDGMTIMGRGDFSAEPRHYFVHADLNRLGPLGILFVSPGEKFESLSIWLAPERPATERLLRSVLDDWKNELRAGGFDIRELGLLPTADADKSPGLDLRA